jgi:hypothetical protein
MVGVSVGEPVFASGLTKYLARYAPDAPAEIIKNAPTTIYSALPAELIPRVVRAYVDSLRVVFLVGVPAGKCWLSSLAPLVLMMRYSGIRTNCDAVYCEYQDREDGDSGG